MGAYDNPKIIQPVNYAEIFNRSQQNIVNTFLQYQAGEQKKKEQAGQIIAESQKKVADFGQEVQKGTEGTLLGSVTNVSQEMTKEFAELERLRIRGELGNADYAQATAGLYKNIGEMKAYNQGLEAFEKSLKETEELSAYQEEAGAVMSVLEAKKNGKLNIMFKGGKLISQVDDGTGNMVPFDPTNLAEAKNLMINEKFDAVAEVQAGADSLKALTRKTGGTFTVKTDAGEVSTKQIEEYIDPKYATEEARIEFLETNSKSTISDINSLEAGSYIVDTKLRAGIKLQQDDLFNDMLQESPYSDAVKDKILDQVTNGQFSKNVVVDGESVDISGFAIAYAKRSMAIDAVRSFGGLQQDVTSRVIDKRTDKETDKPDQYTRSVGQAKADARNIIDALLRDRGSFIREVYGVVPETPDAEEVVGDEDIIKIPTGEEGKFETYDFNRKEDILNLANSIATERYRPGKLTGIFQDEMKSYLLERRRKRKAAEAAKNLN